MTEIPLLYQLRQISFSVDNTMNLYGFLKNNIKNKIVFYRQHTIFCFNWFNRTI